MQDFESLLKSSASAHGHLCPGQVVGVRMAMLGCGLIGLDEPHKLPQIKKLIVYVEMDRCTADAVAHVTGVKLGRRSLKFMDYGIMAATFINLETDKAFRVLSTEEARELAHVYAPEFDSKAARQMAAYRRMPNSVLFRVHEVRVKMADVDMPGPTLKKIVCSNCGQAVRDGRDVTLENRILCKPCAPQAYFTPIREVTLDNLSQFPQPLRGDSHVNSLANPAPAPCAGDSERRRNRADQNQIGRCRRNSTEP